MGIFTEQLIEDMALSRYNDSGRTFLPLYPFLFVRVLPKAQTVGHIQLIDRAQNKTTHEGIVLARWAQHIDKKGVIKSSEIEIGEHVLFPHFQGVPVEGWDILQYRVIREEDILGVIECMPLLETKVAKTINDVLCNDGLEIGKEVAAALMEKFILVDREFGSVTLSGL